MNLKALMDPAMLGALSFTSGLLRAGGPSPYPVSTGAALGQGLQSGVNGLFQGTRMKQLQQLADSETAKTDLLKQQLAQAQAQFALQQRLLGQFGFGATPGAAPQPTPAAGGPAPVVITNPEANQPFGQMPTPAPNAPQAGGNFPFNPTQIAGLRLAGLPDLTGAYNASQPNVDIRNGIAFDKKSGKIIGTVPQTNQQGFSTITVPDPNSPTGFKVDVVPGASDAFLLQQRTAEQAKAEREPFMGQVDAQGRPVAQTREQFAQSVTKGGVQATGPSISQRAGQETLGKGDAERVQTLEQKIPALVSTQNRLDRLEQLTADDATFASAGAEFKTNLGRLAQAFGVNVDKSKTANSETYLAQVAELLKDRLASKDYGSGTGVSNLDLLAASLPLPELAKTAQGRQQIIQAIRADTTRAMKDASAARDYYQENQSLRGFKYPSELERQPIPKTPGKAPAQFTVNKIYTDANGNQARYLGNGKWQEIKNAVRP